MDSTPEFTRVGSGSRLKHGLSKGVGSLPSHGDAHRRTLVRRPEPGAGHGRGRRGVAGGRGCAGCRGRWRTAVRAGGAHHTFWCGWHSQFPECRAYPAAFRCPGGSRFCVIGLPTWNSTRFRQIVGSRMLSCETCPARRLVGRASRPVNRDRPAREAPCDRFCLLSALWYFCSCRRAKR